MSNEALETKGIGVNGDLPMKAIDLAMDVVLKVHTTNEDYK